MDIWGRLYEEHYAGRRAPHVLERDDGLRDGFDDGAVYFAPAPRLEAERELLERIEGPVLDLGAGAGSYALYFQERGVDVTAADASPGALRVARSRGCAKVRELDLRDLRVESGAYRSIVVMGNTIGAHQTPETFPELLRRLRVAVAPGGRLLISSVDPLATTEEHHLAYHRRNREAGRPPGLVTTRLRYREMVGEWMELWLPTADELIGAAEVAGWGLDEERAEGPHRVRLFGRVDAGVAPGAHESDLDSVR